MLVYFGLPLADFGQLRAQLKLGVGDLVYSLPGFVAFAAFDRGFRNQGQGLLAGAFGGPAEGVGQLVG